MQKIYLKTPLGNSKILIKKGLFVEIADILEKEYKDSHFVVITDENLAKIYEKKLKKCLPQAHILTVPADEKSKCFDTVIEFAGQLMKNGFSKNDVLIGFGGGMVTDLAGFIAAIYMRGVKYIVIPTSLLGMVDAAIGGKNGIDFMGKNLIGTIYFPDYIFMDPDLLKSFDNIGDSPGMGEVIKYASIIDKTLFDDLKKNPINIEKIIQKSARAKVNVVNKDVNESGLRKILNFGHTFGHAIEAAADYAITHDRAISIGMVIANKIAQKLGRQEKKTGDRIKEVLEKFSLPTEIPKTLKIKDLAEWIKKDKKRRGDVIDFIIAPELGKAEIIPLKPEELVKLANI